MMERPQAAVEALANELIATTPYAVNDPATKASRILDTIAPLLTAPLQAENAALAAWQCIFQDGKTGLVHDEYGNQYCNIKRKLDAANAKLATALVALEAISLNWPAKPSDYSRVMLKAIEDMK